MSGYFVSERGSFSDTQEADLGDTVEAAGGEEWMYVLLEVAVTAVSGQYFTWKDSDAYEVTNDYSAGTTHAAGAILATERLDSAGAAKTALLPTDGQYGYIQTRGFHPAVAKAAADDAMSDGEYMVASATDGVVGTATTPAAPTAAETPRVAGRAVAASEDGASGTYREDTVPMFLGYRS